MIRLPHSGRAAVFALVLSFVAPMLGHAANPVPTPDDEKMIQLVGKLGADSFDTREEATEALAALGRKAIKALSVGVKSEDSEIARRCSELLDRANRSDLEVALDAFLEKKDAKLLLQVPAWSRFQKMVGENNEARNLFVLMCTSDGLLLDAFERNIEKASQMYNGRIQQLQQRMFQPFGFQRQMITNGEMAALLYVGMDNRIQVDTNLRYIVNNLVHQPGPQAWFKSEPIARKLLATYIENRSDAALIHNHMHMVQNLELRECIDWVGKQAENKSQQPYVRSMAIGTLGKLGGKDAIPKLEALFTDATQLTTFQLGQPNQQVKTEARDVALAMAVLASGQELTGYGYPWLVQMAQHLPNNPNMVYQSSIQLGFSDNTQRDAAFKRYADWKAKQGEKK